MKIKVYNLEGKVSGEMEVSDEIFAVAAKPEVVHEVYVAQTANQRQPWAHTKDRSEVRGGGRKPWAQKGTGRARHGSNRSPIWTGGGVTFGPLKTNNYKKKINKKIRRLALKMGLSDRVANEKFLVVENFDFSDPKTKLFANFLKLSPLPKRSYLVLTAGKNEKVLRATNNLEKVNTMRASDVSLKDVLENTSVIASKAAVVELSEMLSKK